MSNKTALRYPIRDWTDAGSFHIVGDKRRAQVKKEPEKITLKLFHLFRRMKWIALHAVPIPEEEPFFLVPTLQSAFHFRCNPQFE